MFTRGAASRGVHAPPDPHDAPERQVLAPGAEVIPPLVAPAAHGMPTVNNNPDRGVERVNGAEAGAHEQTPLAHHSAKIGPT